MKKFAQSKAGKVVIALVALLFVGSIAQPGQQTANVSSSMPQETASQAASSSQADESSSGDASAEAPAAAPAANADAPAAAGVKAHFIDVGQGDSEFIELPDGKTMLIDAGVPDAGQTVVSYLKGLGCTRIDYLVATHPHADHIGGLPAVISAFDIGEVWAPNATNTTQTFEAFIDAVRAKGLQIHAGSAGMDIVGADAGYSVSIIAPPDGVNSDDYNDYSLVIKLVYGNTSFLFTGDAPAETIAAAQPGHVDVLKVAHHGSNTGTTGALISALSPTYSVISYGIGNDYGHPTKKVLTMLTSHSQHVLGTGANGTIVIASDGTNVTASCDRPDAQVEPGSKGGNGSGGGSSGTAAAAAGAAAGAGTVVAGDESANDTVYITASGKGECYHRKGCSTLKRSKLVAVSRSDAEAQGLRPCSKCNP
jgi:beta-lactamase superfamily II metal-dependent hydrolase